MIKSLKEYYIGSDINKTLEKIYSSEQRPFKISVQFDTTNHTHFIHISITHDTDYKDFRSKVLYEVKNFVEYFGSDVMSRLYFKVYTIQ